MIVEVEIAGPPEAASTQEGDDSWWGKLSQAVQRAVGGTGVGLSLGEGGSRTLGLGRQRKGWSQIFADGRSFSLEDVPEYTTSQVSDLREKVRQLDLTLQQAIDKAALWRERADLSHQLRDPEGDLIALLTSAILDRDEAGFLRTAFAYARSHGRLAMLSRPQVSPVERGELLALMRQSEREAEFHYILHLAYAFRFGDPDIFRQAIDSMRTGYAGEKRLFFSFRETRQVGAVRGEGGEKVALRGVEDLPRIQINLNGFLRKLGCFDWGLIALVRKQFHLLLSRHLPPAVAGRLLNPMTLDMDPELSLLGRKWAEIDQWPQPPVGSDPSLVRWFENLTMERLKELSLNDMFTGQFYRPPFPFDLQDPDFRAEIEAIPWLRTADPVALPPVSDGKPLARLIAQRYADGSPDWGDYFRLASGRRGGMHARARSQRVLVLLVTEAGPLPEFEKHVDPLTLNLESGTKWDIHALTYYCDLYRLALAFRRRLDEQRLFNFLLERLPKPPRQWEDFRDAAEQIILCLFLSNSPVRRFQLDHMLDRTMFWMKQAFDVGDEVRVNQTLTIMSFLEVGVLADLVGENLEHHQFQERRRALWMEHARSHAGPQGWEDWCRKIGLDPQQMQLPEGDFDA